MPRLMQLNSGHHGSRNRGFTLIELMIVVVVIAILAAIGYPMYLDQAIRGKRAEGKGLLMDSAARMERFYSDNNSYATAANTLPPNVNSTSETGAYTLSITTSTPFQTYTLTATPADFTDNDCGNLTLDHTGTRGNTGSMSTGECWGR